MDLNARELSSLSATVLICCWASHLNKNFWWWQLILSFISASVIETWFGNTRHGTDTTKCSSTGKGPWSQAPSLCCHLCNTLHKGPLLIFPRLGGDRKCRRCGLCVVGRGWGGSHCVSGESIHKPQSLRPRRGSWVRKSTTSPASLRATRTLITWNVYSVISCASETINVFLSAVSLEKLPT